MSKQSFRMKKVIAILLAVLFVTSLTAIAASARWSSWPWRPSWRSLEPR
jgi:hypothetical protein